MSSFVQYSDILLDSFSDNLKYLDIVSKKSDLFAGRGLANVKGVGANGASIALDFNELLQATRGQTITDFDHVSSLFQVAR